MACGHGLIDLRILAREEDKNEHHSALTTPPQKFETLARCPPLRNSSFLYILVLHYQNFIEIYKNTWDSLLDT